MGKKSRPPKKQKRGEMINVDRTLTELEKEDWGEPSYPSSLVVRCHALRKKRLRDFTASDFRILIGQKISLPYLIPLAIPILESYAFVEGGYYPGDLLLNVLGAGSEFWEANPDLWKTVWQLCQDHQVRDHAHLSAPNLIWYLDHFESLFPKPQP